MTVFIQYLVNGLSMGSVYAIIALGYTMVYGIAKMLNFAHGDVIMIGGFVIFTAVSSMHTSAGVAIVCAIIGGLIGKKLMKKHFEKAGVV